MKDAIATVGTSLEVLAPYLPYGLPVYWKLTSQMHRMTGLVADHKSLYLDTMYTAFVEDVLPVLRPFSALCQPLEDGTVPAVEVIRLVAGPASEWVVVDALPNIVGLATKDGSMRGGIKHIYNPEWGWHFFVNDRICGRQDLLNIGAAYDYLRSKHFALPVNGRPLLEGVDYIAKPAASATTQEGGSRAV